MIKPLLRKLIVAVNGSEQSLSAAMYSIMLAMQYKCELKAVYVVDTATLKQLELSRFFIPEESARYKERLTEDGQKYLEYVKRLAEEMQVPLLGQIPIVQSICESGDEGEPAAVNAETMTGQAFRQVAQAVVEATERRNSELPPTGIVEMKK